jgi:hypothetical protein
LAPKAIDWECPRSTRDLVAWWFETQIRIVPEETTYTVGTTVVAVGKYANTRTEIIFGNPGTVPIWVGFSAAGIATAGIVIPVQGFLSFDWYNDNELVMRDFFALSNTASQTLYVCESVLSLAG